MWTYPASFLEMDYNVYVAIKRSLWMLFLLSNKVFHTNSKGFHISAQPFLSQVSGEAPLSLIKSLWCVCHDHTRQLQRLCFTEVWHWWNFSIFKRWLYIGLHTKNQMSNMGIINSGMSLTWAVNCRLVTAYFIQFINTSDFVSSAFSIQTLPTREQIMHSCLVESWRKHDLTTLLKLHND